MTVGDAYPFPSVYNILNALSGSKLLGKLDLARSYWQVLVNILINSGQKDVEVFCVALVTYKLEIIYKINDPSAKHVNLKKKF